MVRLNGLAGGGSEVGVHVTVGCVDSRTAVHDELGSGGGSEVGEHVTVGFVDGSNIFHHQPLGPCMLNI